MTESNDNLCDVCGKPVGSGESGSITQWIVSSTRCSCGAKVVASDNTSDRICIRCGKRKTSARSGSFTQWIFRQDLCSCSYEAVVFSKVKGTFDPDTASEATIQIQSEEPAEAVNLELLDSIPHFPSDRYDVIEELGRGVSGGVYRARDKLLRKSVAVKTLHSLTAEQLVAFQNEARAVSKLSHPGIVTVLDFGASGDGSPYMVMEHVRGESLQQYMIRNGPLDESLVVQIFTQIAQALEHAHDKGVFHRDIKPSNILVFESDDGLSAKLVDFGVALVKKETIDTTSFKGMNLAGTPGYMSPDTANGLEYDARSEIYSLGCVMYECLAGQLPFTGESALQILSQKVEKAAPLLTEAVLDLVVSPELEGVVNKALSNAPAHRFISAGEVIQALQELGNVPGQQEDLTDAEFGEKADRSQFKKAQDLTDKASGSKSAPLMPTISFLLVALVAGFLIVRTINLDNQSKDGAVRSIKGPEDGRDFRRMIKFQTYPYRNFLMYISFDNNLTDQSFADLDRVDRIDGIMIQNCKDVTGSFLSEFQDKNLKVLCVNGCGITGRGFGHISRMTTLQELYVKDMDLSGNRMKYFEPLKNLKEVTFSRTKIVASDLAVLDSFPDLEILYVEDNDLPDAALKPISRLSKLVFLSLSGNQFTLEGVSSLRTLKKLKYLQVVDCPKISTKDVLTLKRVFSGCFIASKSGEAIGKYGDETRPSMFGAFY